jgi:hypothetical protein
VEEWLARRADTPVGRLALLWYRRYFDASLVGPEVWGRKTFEQPVGVWLQVDVDVDCVSATALFDQAQADVGCDSVQPGGEWCIWLEAIDASPGAEHRLLEGVVGVVQGAEQAVAVQMQRLSMRRGQLYERLLVTVAGGGEQPRLGRGLRAGH